MKLPSNILVAFAISVALSSMMYYIHIRRNNEDFQRQDLIKACLFGAIIGGTNYLLFSNADASPVINQEILTGMPDF